MNPRQELEALEQLINELLAVLQDTIQSGEILSDEFQGAIAQELEFTTTRIDQLRQQISEIPTEGIPPTQVPPDAQLLWILAGQQEQPFISYLREFPSQATQALLRNPNELSRVIEHLSQTMPPGQQPVIDGIQHADLQSSNVWGTAYNARTGQLKVRFQGGSEYEYDGVPANIYRALAKGNAFAKTRGKNQYGEWWPNKNPSLGAALNQYIKAAGFPYRKIR